LLVEVVVRGRPALESVLAKVLHQALREPQLNTAAVEMVTTLLVLQELQDLEPEVMVL
jgi:cell division protein ZapA (FtsZ GTPase activity inhibitor)